MDGRRRSTRIRHPPQIKKLSLELQSLIKGRMWLKVLLGMILGTGLGIVMGPTAGIVDPGLSATISEWLSLPGYIFLGLLQMIVVPLVFASIILGIAANQEMEMVKRLGVLAGFYFIVTTAVAIAIGITVALLINPGQYIQGEDVVSMAVAPEGSQEIADIPELFEIPGIIGGLFPSNPLDAMASGQMLQVVLFAIIVGIAVLTLSPRNSGPFMELLGSLQEICMTVVKWSMHLAPLAVFGLMAKFTAQMGIETLLGMGVYVATVLIGLLLLFVLYLIIILVILRRSPFRFMADSKDALLIAFSTSSSAATMPVSIKVAEEKLAIRPAIGQFIIPLGATINMNGTALYQGVATVFLAQVFGVDLTLPQLLLVMIIAVGASIGTPSTPGVGIIILATILESVGVPAAGVALIIGVDRILDMSRTSVNVAGDLVASAVMDKLARGRLDTLMAVEEGLEGLAGDEGKGESFPLADRTEESRI
ncbi:dicarboxylate/amino acid:cation symporter [Methanotrichaceae archaeon M04Ac]|uniref:Dicarboxylate/amino acid:cation symporter n=1 Tax=Candidatus Methanocrinis alkalitolerans TaxID=3033395 RepID=A0ABT5XF67_9EURY|nr:dicarboxylate/amino acid:cation symporter [Candidatus Methanocrinis alkalitolerans]MDF0593354.1 dicarboxylate/amino acid:cation symporter [Candidatus Methanocrinis alkalitolerans]